MKIVFLEPLGIPKELLSQKVEAKLSELGSLNPDHEIIYYDTRIEDTQHLIERSRDADVVVQSNFHYGKEVMEHCPNLKLICVAFTGVDHIDMDYCNERGITVCNCAGYSTVAVADLVFGLAIDLARNIVECEKRCRTGGTKDGLVGFELAGKTFGIIGTGAIGSRVAEIANAFGCRVIAYNRSKKDLPNIEFMSMEEVLKQSDILSIHVPQTAETIGLIGEKELAIMKNTAMLINTARGPIVDTPAIVKALNNDEIAGAAIDVFDIEPPLHEDDPIFTAKNTLLTPHIAFASEQAFEKRADIVGTNLAMWIKGTPQNVKNY